MKFKVKNKYIYIYYKGILLRWTSYIELLQVSDFLGSVPLMNLHVWLQQQQQQIF